MRVLVTSTLLFAACVAAATAANAQEPKYVGSETIAQFRSVARGNDEYAMGVAKGALVVWSSLIECDRPGTVGELMAYLLYAKIKPTDTVASAIWQNQIDRGCTFNDVIVKSFESSLCKKSTARGEKM